MYKTFVLLGMNLCGLFNLSIHMDIPLMYLGLYLNVSVLTSRQPKLSFLCNSCSPPCVEILRRFAIFVEFLNGLFNLHGIIKNVLYVYTFSFFWGVTIMLSARSLVYNYRSTLNKV